MIKNPIPRDIENFNIVDENEEKWKVEGYSFGEDFDRPIWLAVINFSEDFMQQEIQISFLKKEDGLPSSAIFSKKEAKALALVMNLREKRRYSNSNPKIFYREMP